jgi:hypothetical protein
MLSPVSRSSGSRRCPCMTRTRHKRPQPAFEGVQKGASCASLTVLETRRSGAALACAATLATRTAVTPSRAIGQRVLESDVSGSQAPGGVEGEKCDGRHEGSSVFRRVPPSSIPRKALSRVHGHALDVVPSTVRLHPPRRLAADGQPERTPWDPGHDTLRWCGRRARRVTSSFGAPGGTGIATAFACDG